MIPYIGDFAEDETIYHYFNTFDSNDPSASVTITNLADTDIYVYKDGSVTDLVTDGASVVIDFDSRTGVHKLTIDTSVHADYSIGSDYMVLIEGTTIDAGTVTAGIFTFSIENRYNDVNVVTVSGTAQTANDNGADINLILSDTGELQTDWANGGRLDLILDIIAADTTTDIPALIATAQADLDIITGASGVNLLTATQASIDAIEVDTGTTLDGKINTIDTNVDAVLVDTGTTLETHLTDIKGGTFSGATDSLEAIRDRGDAAWTTGAGGTPPHLLQSTTIATLASQVSFTLTAGSADDDAYNGAIVVVTDQSTSTQKAVGTVDDYTGSTKTVTLAADPAIFTMATGDTIEIMSALGSAGSAPSAAAVADAVLDEALSGHVVAGSLGKAVADIESDATLILADTGELQTDWADGGRLDLIQDIIAADTTTDIPALIATAQADLDIITGASGVNLLTATQNSIDAIETDTGTSLPALLPAALVSGRIDANVSAIGDDATSATNLSASALGIVPGACEGTPSTTVIQTDLAEATDDHYIGRVVVFTSGAAAGEASDITDYTGATGTITITAITTAPAAGNTFVIV